MEKEEIAQIIVGVMVLVALAVLIINLVWPVNNYAYQNEGAKLVIQRSSQTQIVNGIYTHKESYSKSLAIDDSYASFSSQTEVVGKVVPIQNSYTVHANKKVINVN